MANPEVRDARQDAKEARIEEKVARIREDIPDADDTDDSDAGLSLAAVSTDGGRVTIPDGRGGFIELVSYAQYRLDMAKARKEGEAIAKFRQGMKRGKVALRRYIDRQVREVAQGADALHDRQGRLGDAQASTHHELVNYRSDVGGLLTMLEAPLSSYMKNINRDDPANAWALTIADTIRAYRTMTPEGGQLVTLIALLAEFVAYYDPSIGIASILQKDFNLVRTPVSAGATPGAADLIIT